MYNRLDRFAALVTEDGVDDQLGAVALDHAAGPLLAEHVHQVRAHLQRGDGREVRRPRVEHAAPEHGDTPALALVHRARQLRHDGLHLLQHLRLLGADGGPLLAPDNKQRSAENVPSLHSCAHLLCWTGRCGLSVVAAVVMLALLQLLSTEILRGCSAESEDSAPDILATLGSRRQWVWSRPGTCAGTRDHSSATGY